MSDGNSKQVISNQVGPHDNLEATVLRHLSSPFRKPFAEHSLRAFDQANEFVSTLARPLLLDSCCGTGDSSRLLAKRFPGHTVIGVDKSANRLERERDSEVPDNLLLVRADLNDFFRLANREGWRPDRHYILYPNPWPKSVHLKRRWHGAPVFSDIAALGGRLELRSNWKLYLEEFCIALALAGRSAKLDRFLPQEFLTPFEKKYHESAQALFRLVSDNSAHQVS